MNNIYERWASVGAFVPYKKINPFEDPEELVIDSLKALRSDGRLTSILATWIYKYGHLLITKKLKPSTSYDRRILSAIIDIAHSEHKKLRHLRCSPYRGKKIPLYPYLPEPMQKLAANDPHPAFYRFGFVVKNSELIRPKTILNPQKVFERSAILHWRALLGTTLRTDLLLAIVLKKATSIQAIARTLHASPSTIHSIIKNLMTSGLVSQEGQGRKARLVWNMSAFQPLHLKS